MGFSEDWIRVSSHADNRSAKGSEVRDSIKANTAEAIEHSIWTVESSLKQQSAEHSVVEAQEENKIRTGDPRLLAGKGRMGVRQSESYLAVRPTLCMYMLVSSGASTCTTQSMSGKSSPLNRKGHRIASHRLDSSSNSRWERDETRQRSMGSGDPR